VTPQMTRWFLLCVVVAVACWSLAAIRAGRWDATVSAVVVDLAYQYPVIALLIGLLLGHWFWAQERP
jgi:hypothetical protein